MDMRRLRHISRHGVIRMTSLQSKLQNVAAIVNCVDTCGASRRILEVAASCDIPRLYLFDGIYDVANAYCNPAHLRQHLSQIDPLLYTHAACVDRWSLEAFAALGVHTHPWLPNRAESDDENFPKKPTAAFLIATARTPTFDQEERARLERLIGLVVTGLDRIGADYRFRIGDRSLLASLGATAAENDTEESFAKCIRRYRCLISTPSTIATTAMLGGTPTATLDYRDSPLTQQTGWRIHESTDIEAVLRSMLTPDAGRMTFQAREVAHLVGRTPVEDFILEAAGLGQRSPSVPTGSQAISLSFDYPRRWVWVNWLKRFRRRF